MRSAAGPLVATAAAVLLAGCGSTAPATPPATVTVTVTVTVTAQPAPSTEPATAAPSATTTTTATTVVLPAVKGRNGAIVYDQLHALGLTNVKLASADKSHTVVVLPQNWTATKIEPAAGTTVRMGDPVVVTMTKSG